VIIVTEVERHPNSVPRVSIGLPVFNGEKFLEEAIDSILAQTYEDFELVISDNASTDGTEEIYRACADQDPRIRYVRNETNLGAAKNYNQVVALARGEYFKWAAADDLVAPQLLERCVDVLDRDPSVVSCYARQKTIDEHGTVLREHEPKDYSSPKPHKRFYECVCTPFPNGPVFGVIRMSTLGKTKLIGNFSSSDRVLVGELVLLGRFHELPEYLFFKRDHPGAHWRVHENYRAREAWYDPDRAGKTTFRTWRLFQEHLASIWRVPLSWNERMWCHLYMVWWIRRKWRKLLRDLIPRRA
jgi:glycosyltransferase involved in cell wall biosynthesis